MERHARRALRGGGGSGGFELFGVIPPFEVYSAYAAVNGSGLVVRIGNPSYGVSERCIRTFFYPQPGIYQIDTGINVPSGLPVYVDNNYLIAITSTSRASYCGGSNNWLDPACASISWYVPGVYYVSVHHENGGTGWQYIYEGSRRCAIRTNGDINIVAFERKYWEIECRHYEYPQEGVVIVRPLGVVRLVFNSNNTVSVYKDGQYLYNVRVSVCSGYRCVGAPTQRLTIPVYWEPGSVIMSVISYGRYTGLGYRQGLTYVRDVQTVAVPYYYRYNLTGAYPYRLEVDIVTAEKKIAEADGWIYVNVTYSGYLKLYLGDQLVAYDALYGWTIRRDRVPPPPPPYEPSPPSRTCVPQVARKPKGLIHRNLQQGEGGYTVEVVRRFEVREFGCGIDRTYTETISAGVYTARGTSYHTKDRNNNVCGFKEARNCGGTVYCDECPLPSQQSK